MKNLGWGRFAQEVVLTPVGRVGRVEEIAKAVAFLASPLAGFINGANLRIDGGFVYGEFTIERGISYEARVWWP